MTDTGTESRCDVTVISRVEVRQAILGHGTTARPRPNETTYFPDETFTCAAEMGPMPPRVQVTADWYYRDQKIQSDTKSIKVSEQRAVFHLPSPPTEWTPGPYKVILQRPDIAPEEMDFQVQPFPLRERITRWARQTGRDLLASERFFTLRDVSGSAFLTLLVGLVYAGADRLLVLCWGVERVLANKVLLVGHAVGHSGLWWWILGGIAYGSLHVRNRGGEQESVYELTRAILTFLTTFLLWYQIAYSTFAS
jgi:hypothetical protein